MAGKRKVLRYERQWILQPFSQLMGPGAGLVLHYEEAVFGDIDQEALDIVTSMRALRVIGYLAALSDGQLEMDSPRALSWGFVRVPVQMPSGVVRSDQPVNADMQWLWWQAHPVNVNSAANDSALMLGPGGTDYIPLDVQFRGGKGTMMKDDQEVRFVLDIPTLTAGEVLVEGFMKFLMEA